jgi:hypothetical protein
VVRPATPSPADRATAAAIVTGLVVVGLVATLAIETLVGAPESLVDLGFGYGPAIADVIEGRGLADAARLPAIPYALGWFARVVDDPLAATLAKNLLVLPLLGWLLARVWLDGPRDLVVASGIVFLLAFPQLVRHTLALVPEEGWLVPILALAFHRFLVTRPDDPAPALLPAALALAAGAWIKTTMLALAPLIAALLAWKSGRPRVALLTLGLVAASILALSAVHLANTGRFTPTSSLNGYELWKGNNPAALAHFPERSLDAISHLAPAPAPGEDEWAWSRRCTDAAVAFWREQPEAARELLRRKLGQVFFRIRGEASPSDFTGRDLLKPIGVAWMLGFRIALWLAIGLAVATLVRAAVRRDVPREAWIDAIGFLALLAAFVAPFLIAWGTERRLMPIVIPVFLYLWSVWRRWRVRTDHSRPIRA